MMFDCFHLSENKLSWFRRYDPLSSFKSFSGYRWSCGWSLSQKQLYFSFIVILFTSHRYSPSGMVRTLLNSLHSFSKVFQLVSFIRLNSKNRHNRQEEKEKLSGKPSRPGGLHRNILETCPEFISLLVFPQKHSRQAPGTISRRGGDTLHFVTWR